jgi:hypothetical protein
MSNQILKAINSNITIEDFQFKKDGLDFSVDATVDFIEDNMVCVVLTKVEVEMFGDWTKLEITENLETELLDHLDGNEEFYQTSWDKVTY